MADKLQPEDLTDAQWEQLLERVCQDAASLAVADRQRMVAAGIIKPDGTRVVSAPQQPVNASDDGGGW
jgi:hypothetical protein